MKGRKYSRLSSNEIEVFQKTINELEDYCTHLKDDATESCAEVNEKFKNTTMSISKNKCLKSENSVDNTYDNLSGITDDKTSLKEKNIGCKFESSDTVYDNLSETTDQQQSDINTNHWMGFIPRVIISERDGNSEYVYENPIDIELTQASHNISEPLDDLTPIHHSSTTELIESNGDENVEEDNRKKPTSPIMTPLTKLKQYSFRRKQRISRDSGKYNSGDWKDTQYVRGDRDEENNWITTSLHHPFWFECMILLQGRKKDKHVQFAPLTSSMESELEEIQNDVLSRDSFSFPTQENEPPGYYSEVRSMISIYKYFCSLNGSINRDHGHALKKFLIEMKNKNFDDIKLATYRAATKLFFVQKTTNLHLVDIYNIIEAFRENGLNTLDHSAELDEPRLECIIASVYYSLYKRLPSKLDIDVERCIVILTQWIMHAYDSSGSGKIRVLSVKTALSTLCNGRMIDKFRYVFTQISENNGILNVAKLDNYLRDLLMLPCAIGEEPNFGYNEDILDSFFHPTGTLNRSHTKLDDFLDVFMNEKANGVLFWLHMFNKLSKSSTVEHATQCKGCGKKDFTGLRYKCLQCYNYQVCQDCFLRMRVSGTHTTDHDMKEYGSWNKGERGTIRTKLSCSPSKSKPQKLPDYPKEPEPNKQLDMSNIVPPLPSEPNSPNATLMRTPRVMRSSVSDHSTISRSSTKQDGMTKQDDEHRLISLYAHRLAEDSLNKKTPNNSNSSILPAVEPSMEQKEILSGLEEKNKSLLTEIRQLKSEHEEAVKNAQQMGCDPNLLTELRVLRQRKDELEMRMSALQETRRELMVQLEGLMKLLRNNHVNSPRTVSRTASGTHLSEANSRRPSGSNGGNSSLMRGVNGDVKEAFGKASVKEVGEGNDLRTDLMTAVEDVTSAMTSVVKELSKDRPPADSFTTTTTIQTSVNAEVSVY